jgi:PmbA protein
MTDSKDLLETCRGLVDEGKKKGADAVEAWAEYGKRVAVNVEHNDLKGAEADEHSAVGLRVLKGGALGFAYVNRLDAGSLSEALDDALSIAGSVPADADNGLGEPAPLTDVEGLWDDRVATMGVDDAVSKALGLVRSARAVDERVSIDSGSFSVSSGHEAIATSSGIAAHQSDAAVIYSLFGMAVDGEDVGSFDYDYRGHRSLDDVDVDALGARFGEKVMALLRPGDARAYRGKVLFTAEAFEEVFISPILSAIDGDNVLKGRSRLKEKLGQKIAGADFTLVDDGSRPGALYSSPFDREGLPRVRTPLVEEGVLRTFLYDVKTARRAGTRPTGHAAGSARSLPSIGTTNVRLDAGTESEQALMEALGDGGLMLSRFSGNVDAVSGDFSGVAKGAFWCGGGEKKHPVKETLIAGNAFDLLEKIVARGDQLHDTIGYEGPWVVVDGVDVTSGS